MKILILLMLASAAGAAPSPENRRFTSCPSALEYLDDKSEASQDALSKEFWEHIKKDPVLREHTMALMNAARKGGADAQRMRDYFCLLGTVLANIKHNYASGKWVAGGWTENAITNESAAALDPNNVADNPRAARQHLAKLTPDIKALKKTLADDPSDEIVWKGVPWKRAKLQQNFKKMNAEYQDYNSAVKRTYGLCRHWANDNTAAMNAVPQKSYKIGMLSVYDTISWQAAIGMAETNEHNVVQMCRDDCSGPCIVVDAWGGTRLLAREDFMKGYSKMNPDRKFCD